MRFVSRSASGLRTPTSISTIGGSLGIFGHWTAGPPSQTVRQIQDFHMGPSRGWTDIAYNWLVDVNGTIYEGRGWGRSGAHTQGYNSSAHACCAIAGEDGQVTDSQLMAMAEVFREHDFIYGGGFHLPHRAVGSTACPGDRIAGWIALGDFGDTGELDMDAVKQIAGFHHDTRRLVLAGQVRAEENHRESLLATWRARNKVLEAVGKLDDTVDALSEDESALVADADFIATEGKRQLAELDGVPAEGVEPG